MSAKRISPQQTQAAVAAGALLVAVTSEAGYARQHLEGAISWEEFERRAPALPMTQPIIFY